MSHDATKNTQIQINEQGGLLNIGPAGSANVSSGGAITLEDGVGAKAGTGVTVVEQLPLAHRTRFTLTNLAVTMTDATTNGSHGSQKLYDFPAGLIEVVGAVVNLTTVAAAGIGATGALVGSLGTAAVGTDNATLLGTEADIHPSIAGTLTDSAGTLIGKALPTLATLLGAAVLTDSTGQTPDSTVADVAAITVAALTAAALTIADTDIDDTPSGTNVATAIKASIDTVAADIVAKVKAGVDAANQVIEANLSDLAAKVNAQLAATNVRRLFDGTATAKDLYLNLAVPDAGSSANSTVTVSGTIDVIWVNHGDV